MNLRKLIEEINRLTEHEFVDDFNSEITDTNLSSDENITDQLNAKTKISRALDVLKEAVDDFKAAVVEELDLIADAELSTTIESLDDITSKITSILTGENSVREDNEPVNAEEEPDREDEETEETTSPEEEDEDVEINFDDEAELDLFGNDEE